MNYISVDRKEVINCAGQHFRVNEIVKHQDPSVLPAIIKRFEIDKINDEIKCITNRGYASINFIKKYNNGK